MSANPDPAGPRPEDERHSREHPHLSRGGNWLLAATLGAVAAFVPPAEPAAAQAMPADRAAWVEACADWDEWDKPGPPFRVHGRTYYVGT